MHFPVPCNQYFSHHFCPVKREAQAYPRGTFVASLKPVGMMLYMAAKANDAGQDFEVKSTKLCNPHDTLPPNGFRLTGNRRITGGACTGMP